MGHLDDMIRAYKDDVSKVENTKQTEAARRAAADEAFPRVWQETIAPALEELATELRGANIDARVRFFEWFGSLNLSLKDPFGQDFPASLSAKVDNGNVLMTVSYGSRDPAGNPITEPLDLKRQKVTQIAQDFIRQALGRARERR